MRATDSRGRAAEDAVTITVTNNLPTASITGPSSAGLGASATFDGGRSSDPDGRIASYAWDLDDDGAFETTGARPTVSFATPGRHTVRLQVTDDDGGTAVTVTSITVTNQAPRAAFTMSASRRINTDIVFDATGSSDPDGTVALYEWDLDGNGSYETVGPRPTARYTTTGKRTVMLRVTDAFGLTATASTSITITT